MRGFFSVPGKLSLNPEIKLGLTDNVSNLTHGQKELNKQQCDFVLNVH